MRQAGVIGRCGATAASLKAAGIELVARPIDDDARAPFEAAGIAVIDDYPLFWDKLAPPRAYVVDMAAGAEVDGLLDEASASMEPGDLVIDTTPSYWCDTLRRYRRMRHRALYYVDTAWLTRDGASRLVIGGDQAALTIATPLLERWSKIPPTVLGGPAIAHYAAMIEETLHGAMAQIRNEAALMMEAWPAAADEVAVKALWPLVDRPPLGRAAWQSDDALRLEAATPVFAQTAMLALAEALEEHRSEPPAPRVGGFQHPDEIV